MYPSQVRVLSYVVTSYTQSTQDLTVSCTGDFCANVLLSKSSLHIEGMQSAIVTAKVSVPSDTPYNQSYQFSIVVADAKGHSAVLSNDVVLTPLAAWYNKFAIFVQQGDAGFWFALGSFNVPKLVLYLLALALVELIAFAALPKGTKAMEMRTLVYIGAGLVVVILLPILY